MTRSLFWIWKIGRWVLLVLVVAYVALVIYRIPAVQEKQATAATVARIHAQRLTMNDVDGNHLPPPPDPAKVNATIEGVDANRNGIRDDVELAIFEKYPGQSNIKIRAAALQLAETIQTQLAEVSNSDTWVAATQERGRALGCIVDVTYDERNIHKTIELRQEVSNLVLNTALRTKQYDESDKYRISFGVLQGQKCDVIS